MSAEDELKLNNSQIIIDSASEERLAKHRRICQEHGLVVDRESNLRSVTAVRKYVSNQLVELINDAGIRTAKPPYDEFKTVPKGFMPGPELWVRNHGKTLVGWPKGLKEKSVETWHMNHTYAVAYLLIRNRIYIDSPEMHTPSYQFKKAEVARGSEKKKQMKLEVLIMRRPKTAASARSTATNSTTVAGSSKGKEKETVVEEGSEQTKQHPPISPKKKKLPKSTELIETDEETLAEEEATSSVISPTKPSSAISHQRRKSRDREEPGTKDGDNPVLATGDDVGSASPMIERGISPSLAQVPLHFGEDTLSRGVGFMEGMSWDEGHGFADDEDDEEEEEEEKEDDDSSDDDDEENGEPQATQLSIERRAMPQMDRKESAPRIAQSDGAILLSLSNGSHQEEEGNQDMASKMKADAGKTAAQLESSGPSSSSVEEDEEAEAEEAEEREKEEEEEENSVIKDNEKIARAESSDSSSAPERGDEDLLTIKITPRARSNSSSSSDDDGGEAPFTKEEDDLARDSSASSSESSSSTDEESEEGELPIAKGEAEVISEHSESDTTSSSSSESGEEESETQEEEKEKEDSDSEVSLEPPAAKAADDIVAPQTRSNHAPLSRESSKSGDRDEDSSKDGHEEEETGSQAPLTDDDNPFVAQLPMTMAKHPQGIAEEESSDNDTEEDDEEEESGEDDTDMKEAQVAQEKGTEKMEDLSAPGMTPKPDEPSHEEKEAQEPLQSSLPQSLSSSSYPSLPPPAQPPRQSESSEVEDSHDEDDEVEGEASDTSRSSTPAHDDDGGDHLSLPPPGQPPQLVETSDETSDSESESMSEVGADDESREAKRKLEGDGEGSSPRKKQRTVDTDPDRDEEIEQDRESRVIIDISQVQSGGGPQTITRKPPDLIPKWRERAGIEASSPLEDPITKVSPGRTYQPHPLLQKKWKGVSLWNGESPPKNKAGFGGVKKRKMTHVDANKDGQNSGASKLVIVPPSDAGERIELERERERRRTVTPVTTPRSQKVVDATYTSSPVQAARLSPPKLNKGQQNAAHHRKAARRWPRGGKVK